MNKNFFFLYFKFSFNISFASAQNRISNRTIYNIDKNVEAALQYYGLDKLTIYIQPTNHHIKVSNDDELRGSIHRAHVSMFTIFINESLSYEKFIETLYHEITHVKQLYYGELDLRFHPRYYIFNDDTLGKHVPSRRRPYEIEAYRSESILTDSLGIYRHLKEDSYL